MKKNYLFLYLLVSLLTRVDLSAQSNQVSIGMRVSNQKKEPVPFATFILTDRLDSGIVFKKVGDSLGYAGFNLQKGRQYQLQVTATGYLVFEKGFVAGNQNQYVFTLERESKTMEAVVVTAKKPLMRQEDDKLIVEPENLVASSTNGYEVLEKTPGLFIDQDGNIYISSMTPATVQINGRDMKMSAADMAILLKGLPPNSISKIEIVRTPSAKYEASSSGGVVNVVLKKGVKLGMTGSVNAGWQQGVYGNGNFGLSMNNNTGKKTSYLNLNYNRRSSYESIVTNRQFAPDSLLSQQAKTIYPADGLYGATGATWEVGKKWEITFDADSRLSWLHNHSSNTNDIIKQSSSQLLSSSINKVINRTTSISAGTGIETAYKIDSSGSEWTNDTYFTHTSNNGEQDFQTQYTLPAYPSFGGDGTTRYQRNYFTGRSDLKLKLKNKFTFESGIQSTVQAVKNVSEYFRDQGGSRIKDVYRTNTFHYNENIYSLYLQGSKTFGKSLIVKFGTRLENTNMDGTQLVPGDTSFSIHRTDLFPYVYISRKIMRIAGFDLRAYLVYRRSIRRPSYDQLNPFSRYVDQYLSEVGNPALRPQFTNNYEANISVDERPILAVGINETKDIFSNVVYQADSSNSQAYRTYDNLGSNKEWYFRALGAIPPGGKYFFVFVFQYNHNLYQGLYDNKPLVFSKGTWSIFTYHTLRLDKRSTFTLNGFLRFKGQQQFYEVSSFGALNASINRKFLKDKLVLTASVNDIFGTNKNDFTINQGSINAYGYRSSDSRRVGINLRYSFGIRKKEENNNLFNVDPSN
jgi:iron complex outermembrane receptor protein